MSDLLVQLESVLAGMKPDKKADLVRLARNKLRQKWLPTPGPQTQAYLSKATWLLYGGAAGGGKTDLLVGTALTQHRKAVIFRQQYGDLVDMEERALSLIGTNRGWRGDIHRFKDDSLFLEFGALEKPRAEFSWQGRPHDYYGFDEGAQFPLQKILYVTGWLRSIENIRKRVIIASNPPMGGEGEWLLEWFAPWLDPAYPDPAAPGELRWAIVLDQKIRWMPDPSPVEINGKHYTPESYTFIPARLDDNPYLRDTEYRQRIENMPEPLRSQLLYGDFWAGREDHEWQVIPTAWVKAAEERHRKAGEHHRPMRSIAMDVSMGGKADTVLAKLYTDNYFGPLSRHKGTTLTDPIQHAAILIREQRDEADMAVDATGGWGTGVISHVHAHTQMRVYGIVFSKGTEHKDKSKKLGFKNLRAEMYWRLREALDPESGEDIKLPVDGRLRAQLTTPRYMVRGTEILIESKEEIFERTGSTMDDADAVVMAWHRRNASLQRQGQMAVPGLPPLEPYVPRVVPIGQENTGWMMDG